MTGWVSGVKIMALGTEIENQWHPPPEWARVFITLNDLVEDDVSDIEFHVTHEGLIINVTDLDGEVVGTSSETFDEIIARLIYL